MRLSVNTLKYTVVVLSILACVSMIFLEPIPQDPNYHNFADQRSWGFVPHFWNVITNISFLFQNCSNLKNIPLLDTSNVIDMKGMFQDCSSLKTIPMLNTSNVTEMDYLFERDSLLT